MLDFEVQRCTRRCATTEQSFAPGDTYYSALEVVEAEVVRRDYQSQAWQGPPAGTIGWWRSTIPLEGDRKPQLAPSEVALQLFDQWHQTEGQEDAAYVLALFLVRKRVFRFSEAPFPSTSQGLQVHCPKRAAEYELPIPDLDETRTAAIQEQLVQLLYAEAA